MSDYIERLMRCGFSASGAHVICEEFVRDFGEETLEVYVSMVEDGTDVD